MELLSTELPGVFVLMVRRHGDPRGFFAETFNHAAWAAAGLDLPPFHEEDQWIGAQAGAHSAPSCQVPPCARGRLLRCAAGSAQVAVTDVRRGAAEAGVTILRRISAADGAQIWVPPGRLAGWIALQDGTEIVSNATNILSPQHQRVFAWDSLGIAATLPEGAPPNRALAVSCWASPFAAQDWP